MLDLGTPTVNVLEWNYDMGREAHEGTTTVSSGFDGEVKGFSTACPDLRQRETVTLSDNATDGSGTITDEAKYICDGGGNETSFEQDRVGVIEPEEHEGEEKLDFEGAGDGTPRVKITPDPSATTSGKLGYEGSPSSGHDNPVAVAILSGTSSLFGQGAR